MLRIPGSKFALEIDARSIKKGSQHGQASWDRFLKDFDGILEACWEGTPSQEGAKAGQEREERTRQDKTKADKDGKTRQESGAAD